MKCALCITDILTEDISILESWITFFQIANIESVDVYIAICAEYAQYVKIFDNIDFFNVIDVSYLQDVNVCNVEYNRVLTATTGLMKTMHEKTTEQFYDVVLQLRGSQTIIASKEVIQNAFLDVSLNNGIAYMHTDNYCNHDGYMCSNVYFILSSTHAYNIFSFNYKLSLVHNEMCVSDPIYTLFDSDEGNLLNYLLYRYNIKVKHFKGLKLS